MEKHMFYNTGILARLIGRRDRIRIPIWIIAIVVTTIAVAISLPEMYASELERQAIAETMRNPAMLAMVGQGYGLDNYTEGAMMAHQMLLFTAIAVAIMSILMFTRHTRTDEEYGRIEIIRSLPAGRLANLNATFIVLIVTNVLLSLVVGLGLYALGIESMGLKGSLLYGAALGTTGIFFTAVTALFAQLSQSSRGVLGYSFAVLGISYLIRAIGDAGTETLSWFSPLGWILATETYVNNYWWPLILTLVVSAMIMLLSFYLNALRDLDAGFFPAKGGKSRASAFLQGPFGLASNLLRVSYIAWAIGMFILGASYGSVLGDLETFIEGSEMLREFMLPIEGFTLTDQFLTMLMSVISMIATVPALLMITKLWGEEKRNRVEHLLARAVSRNYLLASYTILALIVAFVMQLLAVIGLWSAGNAVMEGALSFSVTFKAAMAYLPAMGIMIGLAVLLIGIYPKATSFTWLYLGYSFFVVYLGGLLQFPEWMGRISPFGNIPNIPIESFTLLQFFTLLFIGIALLVVGFIGYQRRDITG